MSHQNTPHLYNKRTLTSIQGDAPANFNSGSGKSKPLMDSSMSISDAQAANPKQLLNAYVYDFLLKNRLSQSARIFASEAEIPFLQEGTSNKNSPQMNAPKATQFNVHQQFQKENNLPSSSVTMDAPQSFLFEWWQVFWDVFQARNNKETSPHAIQYFQLQMLRQKQQQEMLGLNYGLPNQMSVPPNQSPLGMQPQASQQQRVAGQQSMDPQQQQQQMLMMQMMLKQQQQQQTPHMHPQQLNASQQPLARFQAQGQAHPQPPQQSQPQQQPQAPPQPPQPQPQPQSQPQSQPLSQQQPQPQQLKGQPQPQHQGQAQQQPQPQMQHHTPQQAHMQNPSAQVDRLQHQMAGVGPNGINVQQQMFAPQQVQPQNRIQQHTQNQMNSLRQQVQSAHQDPSGDSTTQGHRINALAPQQAQQQINGVRLFQQPYGAQNMNSFPQQQHMIRVNGDNKPGDNSAVTNSNNVNIPNMAHPPNRNMHALQDYQMQLMLLEKQNKKRLDIARKNSADQSNILESTMIPPQTHQGSIKNSPSLASNSPLSGNKLSPVLKKKKEPATKRGRKASTAGSTNGSGSNSQITGKPPLQKEYSTPLTPASEAAQDPLTKKKKKNNMTLESPMKPGSKTPSSESKKDLKQKDSKSNSDPMVESSASSGLQDSNNDNIFPVEILGGSSGDSNAFFGQSGQSSGGLDDIDFDFNQFLDGSGNSALNEEMNSLNWSNVDAIENGE